MKSKGIPASALLLLVRELIAILCIALLVPGNMAVAANPPRALARAVNAMAPKVIASAV